MTSKLCRYVIGAEKGGSASASVKSHAPRGASQDCFKNFKRVGVCVFQNSRNVAHYKNMLYVFG